MSKWVLDASAILAFLNQEPGKDRVAEILAEGAVVSSINLSEIICKLLESSVPEAEIRLVLSYLDLIVINFDEELAWETARLRSVTKSIGLSLGDRACLGLARQLNLPVVTADKIWAKLTIDIVIQVIR
jgi:ribonuclease VapC